VVSVQLGDVHVVDRFAGRYLLLVWPTRNETWVAADAQRFHVAGGQTVVYVGERPGGQTGDDVLHRLIGELDPCYRCTYNLFDHACVCGLTALFEPSRASPFPPGTASTTASSSCAAPRPTLNTTHDIMASSPRSAGAPAGSRDRDVGVNHGRTPAARKRPSVLVIGRSLCSCVRSITTEYRRLLRTDLGGTGDIENR